MYAFDEVEIIVKTRNAEEHISDIDADKNKRRTAFIKFASSAVLLCLIIFVYTFSWFTMNKNADVTGGDMKSVSLPFELKTEGTEGFLDSCLDSSYKRLGADSGVLTTADGQSIQWLVTKENNANNYKDSETNEDDTGIHPGSNGTLRFWIVPKEQQTIKVNYNLKITPYKKQYPTDSDGKTNYDAEPSPVALGESDKNLADYVDSHILFFRHYDGKYYSDMIDDNFEEEIKFTENDGGELQPYEVTVYWVWPETLGEAVLANSSKGVICQTIKGTNEVLKKLNENPSGFLKDYEGGKLTQDDITKNYSRLSIQYNNADEDIGDYIMFLTAEMTVSPVNSEN